MEVIFPNEACNLFKGGRTMRTLPCVRLKTELWKRGVKQVDLALSIRIDPAKLSKLINGRAEMPKEVRKSIADQLGMRESELF